MNNAAPENNNVDNENNTAIVNNMYGTEVNEDDLYDTMSSEEEDADADEDETTYDGPFDFEIVGLMMGSSGRACCQHEVCGIHLLAGNVVKLFTTIITNVGGVDESALAVAKVIDGTVGCRVGFVPRVQASVLQRRMINPGTGRFAIVKDIYNNSTNDYKVNKSKRNYGMASCTFIDNVLSYEDE